MGVDGEAKCERESELEAAGKAGGALGLALSSTSPSGGAVLPAPDCAGRAGSVRPLDIRGSRSTYANVTASACRTNHGRKSDGSAGPGSLREVGHLGSAVNIGWDGMR